MKPNSLTPFKYLLAALPLLLLAASCSKEKVQPVTETPPPVITGTEITSIYPTFAKGGETITVYGKKLLQDTAGFMLTVNGKAAVVNQFTNDSLKAIVPSKAGSGKVVMQTSARSYNGPDFSYVSIVTVTTIAGSGAEGAADGPGAGASFKCPWGITADDNNDLYIADCYNRLIRKIDAGSGEVSTIPIPIMVGTSNFYSPYNITIDKRSKSLYVTDFNEHLMKVSANGNMEVILNDAQPLAGIGLGPDDKLYVGNNTTGEIFRLDTTGQNKTTYVSGIVTPRNIIFDKDNNMFVAAYGIYKINGPASYTMVVNAALFHGWEIAVDSSGNFYEADHFNNVIRKIETNGNITTIAGSGIAADVDGIGLGASFDGPQGICIDKEGNLYVTTYNYTASSGNKVRKITFN